MLDKYKSYLRKVYYKYRDAVTPETPNLPVYLHYFNEREKIRIRREDENLLAPWTKDPILANFRFTNVQRKDDRVSRELYDACNLNLRDVSDDLILFNAVMFRIFNTPRGFNATGGFQRRWNMKKVLPKLDKVYNSGTCLFNSAYVIANSLTKGAPRHHFYITLIDKIWKDRKTILREIRKDHTLQTTAQVFQQYDGIGSFVAYEIANDMQMLRIIDAPDSYDWCNIGPGAIRGLNFIHDRERWSSQPQSKALNECRWLLDTVPEYLESHIPGPIDMRFIENGLCETSKYANVMDTGTAKRKYRPK